MNLHAIRAIYAFEMARTRRTLMQSIISPVLSTSLYFVVFGAAIGSRISSIDGISYGAPFGCVVQVTVHARYTAATPLIGNLVGTINMASTTREQVEAKNDSCASPNCP